MFALRVSLITVLVSWTFLTGHGQDYGYWTHLHTGDFNGDGNDDFIRQRKQMWDGQEYNKANLFLSTGDGTYNMIDLPEDFDLKGELTRLYIGDFNGDGNDDFLRQEYSIWDDDDYNTANVFLSNGDGTFTKIDLPEDFALKGDYDRIYMGDFNGDGKMDFIEEWHYMDSDNQTLYLVIYLYQSMGNGTFTQIDTGIDRKGEWITLYVGDYNGDGKADFLKPSGGALENASIFLTNEDGQSFKQIDLPHDFALRDGLIMVYVGDFNGDGKDDFFKQTQQVDWNSNHGTAFLFTDDDHHATFKKGAEFDLKGDPTVLSVGDFNGDGKSDFIREEKGVWGDEKLSSISTYLSLGDGSFNKIPVSEPRDPKTVRDRSQIKNDIARQLMKPLATLADSLGYGWAGGCNNYVGEGMTITEDDEGNILIKANDCTEGDSDGYMSDTRLKITLGDWDFIIKDMIMGNLLSTEKKLVRTGDNSLENPTDDTVTQGTQVKRDVTSQVNQYNLNSASWSVDVKATFTYEGVGWKSQLEIGKTWGRNSQTGEITTNGTIDTLTHDVTIRLPPHSKVKIDVFVLETKSNVDTSTYFLEAQFSVKFDGFLVWGGGTGNYYKQYLGSDERPIVSYKFGKKGLPFYEQLQQENEYPETSPWDWNAVIAKYPQIVSSILPALYDNSTYSNTEFVQFSGIEGTELKIKINKPEPL